MNIVSIIPARGGSKGIPRKNLQPILDKPLIYYSIQPSLKSKYVNKTIVSTEDPEIEEVSLSLGAEVVRRPSEFALDTTPTEPVIAHVLDTIASKGYKPDIVVLLQPTSPFRTAQMIDDCCRLVGDDYSVDSVVTIHKSHGFFWKREGQYFSPLYEKRERRQDKEPGWQENGNIYVTRFNAFKKSGNRLSGRIKGLEIDEIAAIEIDSPFELWLCQQIAQEGKWTWE